VRRVAAGVDVAVDEARGDELAAGVDGAIGLAVEAVADVQDAVVLVDDLAIAQQLVVPAVEPDHPAALHQGVHAALPCSVPAPRAAAR